MKILFCSPQDVTPKLGAPKIQIEVARQLNRLGWECDLVSPKQIAEKTNVNGIEQQLRIYLQEVSPKYDVVEYDHGRLPYPRDEFCKSTLMVARVALLAHHFPKIKIPSHTPWMDRVRRWAGRAPHLNHQHGLNLAQKTVEQADLINVANPWDSEELRLAGISQEKISVLPYGLTDEQFSSLNLKREFCGNSPRVAFVGTFDPRKGSVEFPKLVEYLVDRHSEIKFRLLGTKGLFQDRESVMQKFNPSVRSRIEVYPEYDPAQLPELLKNCDAGLFPSYIESFGFGLVEMMAAGLPVIAYKSPGPAMILKEENLVSPGDWKTMARKLSVILSDSKEWKSQSNYSLRRAEAFSWEKIGVETDRIYRDKIRMLKTDRF